MRYNGLTARRHPVVSRHLLLVSLAVLLTVLGCHKKEEVQVKTHSDFVGAVVRTPGDPIPLSTDLTADDVLDPRWYTSLTTNWVGALGFGVMAADWDRGLLFVATNLWFKGQVELKVLDVTGDAPTAITTVDLLSLSNSLGDKPIMNEPTEHDVQYKSPYCDIPHVRIDDPDGTHHFEAYKRVSHDDGNGNTVYDGCTAPNDPTNTIYSGPNCSGPACIKYTYPPRRMVRHVEVHGNLLIVQTHIALNFFDITDVTAPRFMFSKRMRQLIIKSEYDQVNFCTSSRPDGSSAYFLPAQTRVLPEGDPDKAFSHLGGIDVFVYDGNEAATAAALHEENKQKDVVHDGTPSFTTQDWVHQGVSYNYHIENMALSPNTCAVLGNSLITTDSLPAFGSAGGSCDAALTPQIALRTAE